MAGTGSSGGRNALAPALHAIRGTARADRHEGYDTPEPPKGTPEPPLPMDGMAAEQWDRLVGELDVTGALSSVDGHAIYQFCQLFVETHELKDRQEQVENSLRILEDSLADVEKDDKMALLREIAKMTQLSAGFDNKIRQGRMALRQFLVEFGLTPAARSRVKLPPKKQDSKLDKFRKGA
jgi:P27 family predicted phage terminase small subunit